MEQTPIVIDLDILSLVITMGINAGLGYLLAYMVKFAGSHVRKYHIFYFLLAVPILITLMAYASEIRQQNSEFIALAFMAGFIFRFFKDGFPRDLLDRLYYGLKYILSITTLGFFRYLWQTYKNKQEQDQYRHKKHHDDKEQTRQQEQDRRAREEHARQRAEDFKRQREYEKRKKEEKKSQKTTSNERDSRSPEEILGLKAGYTRAELKQAIREQRQRLHPDKWATRPAHIQRMMEEELKKVNKAYESLK